MTDAATDTDSPAAAPSRPRFTLIGLGVGVLAGFLGLVPWLIGGGALPPQNLWLARTRPPDMPFALLPVNQYYLMTLFALIVIGGIFAGIVTHFLSHRTRRPAWPAALGLLIAHAIAVIQTFVVLANGLGVGSDTIVDKRAGVYFVGMLGGVIFLTLVAQAGFWLASRRSVGLVAVTIGFALMPLGAWLGLAVITLVGPTQSTMRATEVLRWVPAVIIGATLIWCGIRPARRIVAWFIVLATLLLMPPLITTLQYALGNRGIVGNPGEMMTVFTQIFPRALESAVPPVLVALAIGVVGTIAREAIRRARMSSDAPTSADLPELVEHPKFPE